MKLAQLSRRRFLTASAAAVAGPWFIRAAAFGANERIGMGFIGLGGRGGGLMPSFIQPGRSEPVAVCDVWYNRADAARQRFGGRPNAYCDFREVVGRSDVDAVVVATPDHMHVPISVAAMKAGKDVYCEKPLSVTIREGRALADTARRYARVFQHGTHQRSFAGFRHACELALNGYLGKVHTIRACERGSVPSGIARPQPVPPELDYELWLGPAPWSPYVGQSTGGGGWFYKSDYSAGFISGCGVHPMDIAQWGNGTDRTGPVEIEGTGVFPTDGYNDTAIHWNVVCTYANGVRVLFKDTDKGGAAPEVGARFEGTEGWSFAYGNAVSEDAEPKSLLKVQMKPNDVRLAVSNNHSANFLECVRSRAETVAPAEVAHRSNSVCLLSDIAIRLGRKLRWDPAREVFPGDAEANRCLSRAMREPWTL
ncbi:MAG: Gfo/Idh/MocA family oxidoreductase [Planctomycetes bacterium]|nr:Gfo/Idh/MocA family oxidoreductase [Planctomycetota bacterium]